MMTVFNRINEKISDKETAKSMLLNFAIKGFSFLLIFIYIPLVLDYLGDEKYGLWATILSVMTWINLCDIGIGGGLRNVLTAELSEGKRAEAKKSVSTAYVVLSMLSFIIWFILFLISILFGWGDIFNTELNIKWVMLISETFICVNFILALVNVVLYALQVSEQVAFVNLFGNIINILGIVFLRHFSIGNMEFVALIYGLSTFLPLLINNIRIFKQHNYLKPSFKCFDRNKNKSLLSLGIVFFVLQIGGLMLSTTDNIIISQLFGTADVTPIEVSSKLLSAVKGFYSAMMIPVWARTTQAVTKNDYEWLDRMYNQLLSMLGMFGIGIVFLVVLFRPITYIWLRQELSISFATIIVIAVGTFAEMIHTSFYSMLNGMGLIKIQMYIAIIQIITNIPLSILFAQHMRMGVMGVKLATSILFVFSGLTYVFYTKYKIKRFHQTKRTII